jgi:two-component system sensor histidine kinase KdpD
LSFRRSRQLPLYVLAVLAVAALTVVLEFLRGDLSLLSVGLLYLLLIFVLALICGSSPAVLAALLSFLAFNFFLIPPFHTFSISSREHLVALLVYLGVAIVTGQLVAQVRERTELALREQRRTSLLYDLNAALIRDVTLDDILVTIVEHVVRVYGAAQSRILLPNDHTLHVRARYPHDAPATVDRQNLAMATWTLEHGEVSGQGLGRHRVRHPHGTRTVTPLPVQRVDRNALYLPIATAERRIGVLEVTGNPKGGTFGKQDVRLLTSFADQAGLALERARLTELSAQAAVLAQSDELKSALLAAVSHDFRTPLAAIKASATALLDQSVAWDACAKAELLHAIDEEADRLNVMVGNLLDLSRIEGGALHPDKEWCDIEELVLDVAQRLRQRTTDHPINVDIAPALPLVHLDYVEIAQVLMNLGENAIKYTPPGTPVQLSAHHVAEQLELVVRDDGPGISAHELPHLFEPFYRGERRSRVTGTGLGLTICKGLVEAHGGQIRVESQPGNGTSVYIRLPLNDKQNNTA